MAGARILARQLRDAVSHRHERALDRVGRSVACPFDLHALLPVPETILALDHDDPVALRWLWENWGTTEALRHVREAAAALPSPPGEAVAGFSFWSADWSPWRALRTLATQWPALRFDLRPTYER
jgi:hypothetical protein